MKAKRLKGYALLMAIVIFCVTVWFLILWGTGVIVV